MGITVGFSASNRSRNNPQGLSNRLSGATSTSTEIIVAVTWHFFNAIVQN
jgi:hypothetical protein